MKALEKSLDFLAGFMLKTAENDGKRWKGNVSGSPS
jgi:hypothetical protein